MSGNRGKGRPKGAQNKSTRQVKEALQAVYAKKGGDTSLLKWAKENETEFYKLWGRMLPQEVAGDPENPVHVVSEIILRGVRSDANDRSA